MIGDRPGSVSGELLQFVLYTHCICSYEWVPNTTNFEFYFCFFPQTNVNFQIPSHQRIIRNGWFQLILKSKTTEQE